MMVRPNRLQEKIMDPRQNYRRILDNFEEFCDGFEAGAAKRFSGQDNDSRQPIDNAEVQRVTPAVIREINHDGAENLLIGATSFDVQATEGTGTSEHSGDVGLSS